MKGLPFIFSTLFFIIAFFLLYSFYHNDAACADNQDIRSNTKSACHNCHKQIRLDTFHEQSCIACHNGKDTAIEKEQAHSGLLLYPSHPQNMEVKCGSCHPRQVEDAKFSSHFTLKKKINAVRQHFGAQDMLTDPLRIPLFAPASSKMALADDMLRRRCLRCHVYSAGDDYAAVRHGTGCSACHLSFRDGELQSHSFALPTDQQCLSCHYGNKVGSDYYGRYQQDFHWSYRTPFTLLEGGDRPYGVQDHNLIPDIHQQRGLICIDCHQGVGHGTSFTLRCATCHNWQAGQPVPQLSNLRVQGKSLILRSRQNNVEHPVPSLQHPAHAEYEQRVSCQVCHAQWSFNDTTTHLLLSEGDDFNPWELLYIQSSSEIEQLMEHNLYSVEDELDVAMRDGLSGIPRPGIWLLGYTERRWERMIFAVDKDGIIKVFRPILSLRLSMVDEEGNVRFDNIQGDDNGLRPYTPHTTGPAGVFYRDRFQHLLQPETRP